MPESDHLHSLKLVYCLTKLKMHFSQNEKSSASKCFRPLPKHNIDV